MRVEEVIAAFFNVNQSRFSNETIRSYRLSLKQFYSVYPFIL